MAAYFLAGKAGLLLSSVHPSATAVWPPTGLALAALIVWGPRLWPGVFLGALLVNLTISSVPASVGIATGNTLEALAGAWLVSRFAGGARAFERPEGVFAFAALAGLSTLLSATVGVSSLCLTGEAEWARWTTIAATWWLGDTAGALLVAPAIVLASRRAALPFSGRPLEALALLLCTLAVGAAVFHGGFPFSEGRYPLEFLCLPLLIWAALRFGPLESAGLLLVLAGVAIPGTLSGFGPFARETPAIALVLLQAGLGVMGLTSQALAAAVLEQRRDHQARLEAQRKLQAFESQSRFIANAAHELRTPVTTIVALAELVGSFRTGLSEAQLAEQCSMLEAQGLRLRRLIHSLLDLSRLEHGLESAERRPMAVAELAQRALQSAPPPPGVSLELSVSEGLTLVSDPLRVEQVLVNLLSNAWRHGGGRVGLDALGAADDVLLVVRDEGDGIPAELLPHLFEPFARGRAVRGHDGAGLGLAITRGIVQALGGSVRYEPAEPRGSRFEVRLPRELAQ